MASPRIAGVEGQVPQPCWPQSVWAVECGAYLLEVRVQLFQHYFQLVHLACQIQGWLLAGKTEDRVRPLSLLRSWGILSLLVSPRGASLKEVRCGWRLKAMCVPALKCAFPRGWTMYVLREKFCPSVTSTKQRIHPTDIHGAYEACEWTGLAMGLRRTIVAGNGCPPCTAHGLHLTGSGPTQPGRSP